MYVLIAGRLPEENAIIFMGQIPFAFTIRTPENGVTDESSLLILIPGGSAHENINGLSHLFEHLLIAELIDLAPETNNKITGYTTEDYILILIYGMNHNQVLKAIKKMDPDIDRLAVEKEIIIDEIESHKTGESENFFRFAWKDTIYEKSPWGKTKEVKSLTREHIKQFKKQVLDKDIYFYPDREKIHSLKKTTSAKKINVTYTNKKNQHHNGSRYDIFYFTHGIEQLFLLEIILEILYPKKHIQISEKKELCALIIEEGVHFPTYTLIRYLKEKALLKIKKEIINIKKDFFSRGINELESLYFYNQSWSYRQKILNNIDPEDLMKISRQIGEFHDTNGWFYYALLEKWIDPGFIIQL